MDKKWVMNLVGVLMAATMIGWVSSVEALRAKVVTQMELLIKIDAKVTAIKEGLDEMKKQRGDK